MIYYAIDVETANPDYSSLCQIGIVKFDNEKIIQTFVELINPEDYFDSFNSHIHGITKDMVKNSLIFPQIYKKKLLELENQIVIHHAPFDKSAINRACIKYNLPILNILWLDSVKIARKTWEEYKDSGYSLSNLTTKLSIELNHHDALSDAIAAGKIVNKAIDKTGISLENWISKLHTQRTVYKQIKISSQVNNEINLDGPLFGETLLFTGELTIPRKEAALLAVNAGCIIADSVTKKVTIIVVGQQDLRKVGEKGKSSKQIKAEELINKGNLIKIIGEEDFYQIIS